MAYSLHGGMDQHRILAAKIADALALADMLDMHRVAIGLNDALEHLTGHGVVPPGAEPLLNAV